MSKSGFSLTELRQPNSGGKCGNPLVTSPGVPHLVSLGRVPGRCSGPVPSPGTVSRTSGTSTLTSLCSGTRRESCSESTSKTRAHGGCALRAGGRAPFPRAKSTGPPNNVSASFRENSLSSKGSTDTGGTSWRKLPGAWAQGDPGARGPAPEGGLGKNSRRSVAAL